MKRSRVRVKVELSGLKRLVADAPAVLRALDVPLHATVRQVMDVSSFLVPRSGLYEGDTPLAETAFISGPVYNPSRQSTTFAGGYEHEAAGAIHEGFHGGLKAKDAPDFLRRAFKGAPRRARAAVSQALWRELTRRLQPHQ